MEIAAGGHNIILMGHLAPENDVVNDYLVFCHDVAKR
jgi:hypothetical protein